MVSARHVLLRRSAAVMLALATSFASHAQGTATPAAAAKAANTPIDMRVGAPRTDGTEIVVEGGLKASGSQTLAMPLALGRDYRIGPNDLLDIDVLDADNLKRTVRVNATGAVSLPLIGQVNIGGLTSQEAEERISARYSEKYLQNPQVSVFIKEFTAERVTVDGAIARPGMFPLTGPMTLLRVIAVAGGFAQIADPTSVLVYRVNEKNVKQVAVFDVTKIRAGQADDPPIKGDDLIVVQRDSLRAFLKDSVFRDVVDSVNPFSVLVPR